ncbi:sensor histidine kinase [Chryseobacterium sp. L7]|uniref:histidine kinase n=1 Tax=Chryseobacterium endalhagicum TaxID=2797638 RepID=A0ABS1QKA3_9FLAO|nr:sensor histidine kinase [Chryseobacterium endalhagicum]MBL1222328.1 sensor histidine kinase [Chryseobacterium endalhagicum]
MIPKLIQRATVLSLRIIGFLAIMSAAVHPVKAQEFFDQKALHDSLYTILKTSRNDSVKARVSFHLAHYWSLKDFKKAEKYLVQGRSYFKNNRFLLGIYYSSVIDVYLDHDPVKARKALQKADSLLSIYHTKDVYNVLAKSWYSEAISAQNANDEKKALDIIVNKVIPYTKKNGKKESLAMFYSQVGILLMNANQLEKAEEYFSKVILMKSSLSSKRNTLLRAYIYSADAFVMNDQLPEAKTRLDEAVKILDKNPNPADYADYYKAAGSYFEKKGQYETAFLNCEKGIKYAKEIQDTYLENNLLRNQFEILFKAKQYKPAEKILHRLVNNAEYMANFDSRKEVYEQMARISHALNKNDEAYEWQKKYISFSDSLYQAQLDKDILAIEAKFKNSEKEKTIVQLQAGKKQQELKNKNQKLTSWILGITGAALLTGLFFLAFYYKSAKKLSVQKEINHQQHLNEIEHQHHLKLVQEMLDAEERERQRIGRDLHDGLGGMLAGIKMNLTQQQKTEYHNLTTVISRLDESVVELRRIARNMMPESLLKIGLETSLRDLCELLQSDETIIDFQSIDITKTIPDATQMHIYRIVQELLANAIRHGHPSNIMLQCSQNQNIFYITVEDDGKGFDVSLLDQSPGIGFTNIKNRVEYLKGSMEIVSAIGEGTTINIELHVDADHDRKENT